MVLEKLQNLVKSGRLRDVREVVIFGSATRPGTLFLNLAMLTFWWL